jgi:hypothetical protein
MSKINLSAPPYQVPCPVCKAFAMAPCRTDQYQPGLIQQSRALGRELVQPGTIMPEPHDVRWAHWGLSPHLRVKVTDDTWVRWTETFQEWVGRMVIHCPTARTYGELMFFAAEKLDMTTNDYQVRFFPEMGELTLSTRLLGE